MTFGRISSLLGRAGWRPWIYLLLLLVNVHVITLGVKAGGEDWQVIFYPWADALRYSVQRYGQFPWWNAWAIGGQPYMADPQAAVFMPDSLILLGFGSIVGFKILIVLYQLVGYEGCRRLCRHLFGASAFVDAVSVIPVLLPALALHFNVGHVVFLTFYLFPWFLVYALTWHESPRRAVGFGVVIGLYMLSYIHYTIVISFTILPFILGATLIRHFRSRAFWQRGALVICTALGIGLFRIGLTYAIIRRFPRVETEHYPIVASLAEVIRTLIEPLQTRDYPHAIADLAWWDSAAICGVLRTLLAYEGLRRGNRKLWPIHAGALIC